MRGDSRWRGCCSTCPGRAWPTVYQQSQRWLKVGVFKAIMQDLCAVLRPAQGCNADPLAAIFDSPTAQSTPESSTQAGYDGVKRRHEARTSMWRWIPWAICWHCMSLRPVSKIGARCVLSQTVQESTGEAVEVACVNQGYTGDQAAEDAHAQHMRLEVVKLPAAKRGLVLLPRRWVVERSNALAVQFRPLARDDERLVETIASLHVVAFTILMLKRFVAFLLQEL